MNSDTRSGPRSSSKKLFIFFKYQSKLQSNPLELCQNEIQRKSPKFSIISRKFDLNIRNSLEFHQSSTEIIEILLEITEILNNFSEIRLKYP